MSLIFQPAVATAKGKIMSNLPTQHKLGIYNDPLGYADLILNGDPEEYLKNVTGNHGLED
jgi:hypothetical protein